MIKLELLFLYNIFFGDYSGAFWSTFAILLSAPPHSCWAVFRSLSGPASPKQWGAKACGSELRSCWCWSRCLSRWEQNFSFQCLNSELEGDFLERPKKTCLFFETYTDTLEEKIIAINFFGICIEFYSPVLLIKPWCANIGKYTTI